MIFYDVTFNILDVNTDKMTITVAITKAEKISVIKHDLKRDGEQDLYFQYGIENIQVNVNDALEQGFVTEQTRFRLKELETQISMLDVEIEIEKQSNYTYLTEEMVLDFFNKVICGDIQNQEVRKQIVKMFIREILIYNDKMLIIYNFTDQFVSKAEIPMMFIKLN